MNFDSTLYLDNRTETIKLRKHENNLIVLGMGIMVFGLWTIAKTFGIIFLNKASFVDLIVQNSDEEVLTLGDNILFGFLIIVMGLILLVGLLLRLYIGMSAISVGRYKRKKRFYIPVTFIYLIIVIAETIYETWYFFSDSNITNTVEINAKESPIVSIIIEFTSVIMFTELLVSAIKVDKIRKGQGKEKTQEA